MVESYNENATSASMVAELCASFNMLKEGDDFDDVGLYDDYDAYITSCKRTPPGGIEMKDLIEFTMKLQMKKMSVGSVPCISVEKNGLKLVFKSKADMDMLQTMADLLVYIQDSDARMTAYAPIYELLKAMIWHVNGLFEHHEEIPALFDADTAGEILRKFDVDVDESIMKVIYAKYMESATGITQMKFLDDHGVKFSSKDIESFSDWLNSTEDTDFLYTREQIKKSLAKSKQSICSRLREMMIESFSLVKKPGLMNAEDDALRKPREASEEVRARAMEAAFSPVPQPKFPEPNTSEQKKVARLRAIFTPPPYGDEPEVTVINSFSKPTPVIPMPIYHVGEVGDEKKE